MTLVEFLLARIAVDEEWAKAADDTYGSERWSCEPWMCDEQGGHVAVDPPRFLAECEAKRRIIEWHKSWPVLATTPPTFERVDGTDPSSAAFRASSQMAWLTEQEYRNRFGTEPPTGPVLRFLALPYADHPDYNPEWRP